MKSLTIIVLALTAVACSGQEPAKSTPAEQTVAAADADSIQDYPTVTTTDGRTVWKPPFSADEIRKGTPAGLVQHIVMIDKGQRFVVQVSFDKPDADGVTISNVPVDGNAKPLGKGTSARTTWAELESHAYFDVSNTTVAKSSVTTTMGDHEALLFTTTKEQGGQKHVDRAWFALDLPGAPVRYEKTVDGEKVMTMEIVNRIVAPEEPSEEAQ